jgi:flagellar hook assembly protein FlgD
VTPTITVTVTETPTLPPTATATPAAKMFLDRNHFNPERETLSIQLGFVEPTDVNLEIYSLSGRKVWSRTLSGVQPGYQTVVWDGHNTSGDYVGSGAYFVVLQREGQKQYLRKVLVIK